MFIHVPDPTNPTCQQTRTFRPQSPTSKCLSGVLVSDTVLNTVVSERGSRYSHPTSWWENFDARGEVIQVTFVVYKMSLQVTRSSEKHQSCALDNGSCSCPLSCLSGGHPSSAVSLAIRGCAWINGDSTQKVCRPGTPAAGGMASLSRTDSLARVPYVHHGSRRSARPWLLMRSRRLKPGRPQPGVEAITSELLHRVIGAQVPALRKARTWGQACASLVAAWPSPPWHCPAHSESLGRGT